MQLDNTKNLQHPASVRVDGNGSVGSAGELSWNGSLAEPNNEDEESERQGKESSAAITGGEQFEKEKWVSSCVDTLHGRGGGTKIFAFETSFIK